MTSDLPELSRALRDRYLDRLGGWSGRVSAAGLAELQRKHLHAVPFHNLALLANDGRSYRAPSILETVRDNARGVGGTCHLTTPAFAALLNALGFRAALVAGTIRKPGDHIMARVRVEGQDFVVDVGNGHPYVRPFPLGGERRWTEHGWAFVWRSDESGHRLSRVREGREHLVYSVDPHPRAWEHFEPIIRGHHERQGFGPFLGALRAVRMTPDCIQVLRNGLYSRYSRGLVSRRPVTERGRAARLLRDLFNLESDLVERGLDALLGANPNALACQLPSPKVFVVTQTIGRTQQVHDLVQSIEADRLRSGLSPEQIEILVLDNQAERDRHPIRIPRDLELCVDVLPVRDHRDRVAESLRLSPAGQAPLPIGAGRHALLKALHPRLKSASSSSIVWLVDDDIQFAQLAMGPDGPAVRDERALLAEVVELWRSRPELSVAIGTYTGDPPIPAFATWAGQLRDLVANLRALAALGPEGVWAPQSNDRSVADFYYDHGGDTLRTDGPSFWLEGLNGHSSREVLTELAERLPGMLAGRQVFRPLLAGGPPPSRPTSARGGNVVFLDADTLFAAPFPSLSCADGVVTRRADSLAAALLERKGGVFSEVVDLPLLHGRRSRDLSSPAASEDIVPSAVARFMEAQARGIALGRAMADGQSVGLHLAKRRALHREGVGRTREGISQARGVLLAGEAWWHLDPLGAACCERIEGVLERLAKGLPTQSDLADAEVSVDEELERFLEVLPERAGRWEASWT